MKHYFSQTSGFLVSTITPLLPDDAIEITKERHIELQGLEASGFVITVESGAIEIKDRSVEYRQESARAVRDAEIDSSMWLVERHRGQLNLGIDTSITASQFSELLAYHQLLRDWPAQSGWPDIGMPTAPDWIASLKK